MTFDDQNTHAESSKKQKTKRACDVCRRKKIGCDGPQISGGRCSNCIASNCDCSYTVTAKKRVNSKEYVAVLEGRLDNMEKLLKKLCPGLDSQQMANLSLDPGAIDHISPVHDLAGSPSASASFQGDEDSSEDNADDYTIDCVTDGLSKIKLDSDQHRFFGKSSNFMMIKQALDLKKEYTGEDYVNSPLLGYKRREYWNPPPWELSTFQSKQEVPDFIFPDQDLMVALIDIYFDCLNWLLPILHRPTFERSVADGLHYQDKLFASTLLMVFAVSSRYSDDPRVLMEGTNARLSSGWKWFNQVRVVRRSLLSAPTLYELQFYCLSTLFLHGSSMPQSCWTMVGIGIRLAQEIGAHRRKPPGHKYTVQDELLKRAFWALVCIDRSVSAAVGRPCAVRDEDFDVEPMIECDDEYWEHPDPDKAFKQPPGKPSLIACSNAFLRLSAIQGRALRELYCVSKPLHNRGKEQAIVAELDSALNQWIDSVPDHLRWDPNREDSIFYRQSVALYSSYYNIQILIHRPFISTRHKPSPLTFPSLAICTNAARSCCRIIDKLTASGMLPGPQVQLAAFSSAVVLLFHIWGGKKAGLSVDSNKGMEDVHRCMKFFKRLETRWQSAGRCWDVLYELACVGELPLPQPSPPSNKRERDESEPISDQMGTPQSSSSTPSIDEPRPIAGSRRVASKYPAVHIVAEESASLPMNSYQLGQFPTYPQLVLPGEKQVEPFWTNDYLSATAGDDVITPDLAMANELGANSNFMDEAFYDQMSFIFSNPFGERSGDEHRFTNGDMFGMSYNALPPPPPAPPFVDQTAEHWGYGSSAS